MKINRIEIAAFGKFKDFSVDFSDGFNLIYGENEAGKSTLMAFIALMLYGNAGSSGRTDISKNIRKKYMPWSGEKMSGDMEIEGKGRIYRIHKEFKATSKSDRVSITDMETGEKLNLPIGMEIGKYFLGVDYQGFEKSIFGFGAESIAGEENADISSKLSNISESGDEEISPKTAIARLEKAREDLVSKRGNKGHLVDVNNRISVLEEQIAALRGKTEQQSLLKAEYDTIEKDIEALNKEAECAAEAAKNREKRQRAGQMRRLAELFDEVEQKEKSLTESTRVTAEDLKTFTMYKNEKAKAEEAFKAVTEAEKEQSKRNRACFKTALPIGIAGIIIGIIGGILNRWFLMLELIGVAGLIVAFLTRKKDDNDEIDSARDRVLKAVSVMEDFLNKKGCENQEQLEVLYRQGISLEEEIKILNKNIEAFRNNYEIYEDDKEVLLNLAQEMIKDCPAVAEEVNAEEVRRLISFKNARLLEIKGQLGEAADIGGLERELSELLIKKEEMTSYYNALTVASEVMSEAADEMSRSFAPRLKKRASELIEKLTGGKYSTMSVSKTYDIEVKTGESGAYRPWQYLSRGTTAQSYLALRLALCEMLEDGEKIPLILDDVLADYDEKREKQAAEFLEEYAQKGRQVLFFTCHNRKEQAEKGALLQLFVKNHQ